MADFSFIVEINEQNLTEILQQSLENHLSSIFTRQRIKNRRIFLVLLEQVAEQYQGQFILGKVDCEKRQMIAAQFRIQAYQPPICLKKHRH